MILLRNMTMLIAAATSSLLLSAAPSLAQQCEATLTATRTGITRLEGDDPRSFVMGNFHTNPSLGVAVTGRKELRDVAYVSTRPIEGRNRHVLNVLLSIGNGCFIPPARPASGLPDVVLGDKPTLIAAGDLNGDDHEDIAIIDTYIDSQFSFAAKLRIFVGDGAGHFKAGAGVSVLSLQHGQRPVAMAMGKFRGMGKPIDIAVASTPLSATSSPRGQLTMLVNNGAGEFSISASSISLSDFEPAAMLASDQFRKIGKYDLVIKEAAQSMRKRILYLQNSGDGRFPDISEITGTGAAANRAGDADALLASVFQSSDTAGDKLDIVTFDKDMTLRLFVNDGFGGFNSRPPIAVGGNVRFAAGAQFFDARSGDDKLLHLIAAVERKTDGGQGMWLLTNNGSGGFESPRFRPFQDLPTLPEDQAIASLHPFIASNTESPLPLAPQKRLAISSGILGQFLNPRHGNQKPDLAVLARHIVTEVKEGSCESLTSQRNFQGKLGQVLRAGYGPFLPGHDITCYNPGLVCIDHLVECQERPVFGKCFCRCADDTPSPPPPPPPPAFCNISKLYPFMLVVFANPFDDQ